ncbi:MAG: DHA2 family efflux MFS transporter permease subunit [Syntrophaceae bacterium]
MTVLTGAIMSALDSSIVNVALPHMMGSLGASVEEITWVSTGYILSSVIIMPIVALLSSRFGRKRLYLFSVLLFTCASTLCGFAWDLPSMVIFRIIEGLGGGTLIVASQAILRETFPPEEQGIAMGIYGLGVILGPAIGPTLGGWLTDTYSWPWIFFVKSPLGIITALLVVKFIEDPPYLLREKRMMDLAGLFFMTMGLGALQIMLEKGQQKDWFSSSFIISLAAISCMSLIIFIWRELTTDEPAVNLRILSDFNFSSATLLSGILTLALMGSLFLLPLLLQQLLQYTAYDSGLALMPRSIAMGISMPLAGWLYNRTGPRLLVVSGLLINVVSFYQLSALSIDVGFWDIFVPQFIQGIGFGLIFVALSTAALSHMEKRLMTAASGLFNVIRQVMGSVGIAVAATLLSRGEQVNRALLVEHVSVYRDVTVSSVNTLTAYLFSRGVGMSGAREKALKVLDGIVMQQSGMLTYNHIFFLVSMMFLLSIPLVLIIKDKRIIMES